ncbi:thrombospondin-type laminin G domain and EAR repeat-containing protein-like [Ciona intestinalis]
MVGQLLIVTLMFLRCYAIPQLCSDSTAIDLLGLALGESPDRPGIEVVDDVVKGYRFDESARLLGVDSDVIFTHCNKFPAEFSFIVTYKHHVEPKQSEFVMSLLAQNRRNLLVGIRIHRDRLFFDYAGSDVIKRSVSSRIPTSGSWKTMIVTLAGGIVKFTLDCGQPTIVKLKEDFPRKLNLRNTRFFIASKRTKMKRFTGLLREVVLLPGADAANRVCQSNHVQPSEAHVTIEGESPIDECTSQRKGIMTYKQDMTLEVCTGTKYQKVRAGLDRMDYVIDYADIDARSNSTSIEIFNISGVGTFLATANKDHGAQNYSEIFLWDPIGRKFDLHQTLRTQSATRWKYFDIGHEHFLAVANYGGVGVPLVSSVIYRWSRRRGLFMRHQVLASSRARDVEAFDHDGDTFLVLVNHNNGGMWNVTSMVYKWNPRGRWFEPHQSILTYGALGVSHFQVHSYSCIAIANAFDGTTSVLESVIYCMAGQHFIPVQYIETMGAADWEFFVIGDQYFLAVANNAIFTADQSQTTTMSVILN